ncbi:ABC transporter ATP-binding protein [Lentzea flaviverrucosa]|uniref:Energy-coupling factor transport system ATP-binding protein n=1 Tax=Lentzea flaviverrucosa TaxID=200379 RepID=A0A1H9VLH3_9PSEU|nr:ABC transporter ATP-binding protein [Lentzea flaviverrucosa]RDI23777.1 energy-coupling factor transport system ATP-binding protein [Lentzea flaviverrucosa]SES22439.1 energy-coupling factor transport system ATP-binding protein [Lentzea flaviverrucosa]
MIRFEDVTITYTGQPVLADICVEIPEGELCLVVGRTGSGKSTFLRAINGLVPHFSGGTLAGRVLVDGRDTATHPPRELADVVGFVGQDPVAGFVADNVEDELAYSMESLGLTNDVMRKRVEETLDLLGLAALRDRPLATLSGGQQQRVAIGAALTAHPRVLVLDEPTSALDPGAAEDVLAAVQRLVHDLGMTVVIAEHRLERVAQYADRALLLPQGKIGDVGEILAAAPVAPPVVRLAQFAGWEPVPVSVRDARRRAAPLRARLPEPEVETVAKTSPVLEAREVVVRYGDVQAVRGVTLDVGKGERVALMGRNGSGKSSLLWAVQGSGKRTSGTVAVAGADPKTLKPAERRQAVALVPQQPSDLLYLETVAQECAQADSETGQPAGTCRELLQGLASVPPDAHPRDLSEGQRLALVLAVVLTGAPDVLLLDEPTRGLDYPAKEALAQVLKNLPGTTVLATHDVEFVAEYATRVVVMAEGEVVADGPAREVVTSSPIFAPQVSKVLGPWLTVADVEAAL